MSYLIFNLIKMRGNLAEGIFAITKEKRELIAEMARQMGICYAFKAQPPYRVLHSDFFPFSTLPFEISKKDIEHLEKNQLYIQELFLKASEDREFINHIFRETKKTDEFVRRLLYMYNQVYDETKKQPIRLNIIRNDYIKDGPDGNWSLVQFNAISPGSGTTSDRLQSLNYFLSQTLFKQEYTKANTKVTLEKQEYAKTLDVVIEGWKLYNNPNSIMLLVWEGIQENIHDQLDVELYFTIRGIRVVRGNFAELDDRMRLKDGKLFYESDEVGLVMYRAGYIPAHYTSEKEWKARKTIELSQAIKVPSLGMQLINFKRAQIDLCTADVLKKYIGQEKIQSILQNVVPSWDFDNEALQEEIIKSIVGKQNEYVLKPNLEAGGNNIFNQQILETLQKSTPEQRKAYVLMKKIRKSIGKTVMFKLKQVLLADTITQIGFFGAVLAVNLDIKANVSGGNLIKSKFQNSEGGGIVVGNAVFDAFILSEDAS